MAASIKALNAKMRQNKALDYFFSTHFWGPASNFGIPIAAVMDTGKDPEIISGAMTTALLGYSAIFMRYAFAVTPKNYLLFGCHLVNFSAQSVQAYRYTNYHYMGGKPSVSKEAGNAVDDAKEKAKVGVDKVKQGIDKIKGQ